MLVKRQSTLSGEFNTMDLNITSEQLSRYENGVELIQNIFPNLSPDDREFLISGITPTEWNTAFGVE